MLLLVHVAGLPVLLSGLQVKADLCPSPTQADPSVLKSSSS
jgi:hypothetical protein